MMGSAKIEYANIQASCFAVTCWPIKISHRNLQIIAVETENQKKHFFSVSGSGSAWSTGGSTKVIKINGKHGMSLRLRDGEKVVFTVPDKEPVTVTTAKVSCCSENDWEILETNAKYVTNHLLDQLRVVYPGQEFPFWLSKSLVIHLRIDEITPAAEYGILEANSDIVIPCLSRQYVISDKLKRHHKLRIHPSFVPASFKLLPSEALLYSNIFHGFTYKSHLECDDASDIPENLLMSILVADEEESSKSAEPIIVRLHLLDSVEGEVKQFFPFVNIPCIYIHPELMKTRQLSSQTWVWITPAKEDSTQLPMKLSMSISKPWDASNDSFYCGSTKLLYECVSYLKAALLLNECQRENYHFTGPEFGCVLIEGAQGSGKTTTAIAVAQSMQRSMHRVSWEMISCAKLRGKKSEKIEKEILKSLKNLEKTKPSILILDDLDVLTGVTAAEEQSKVEEIFQFRVSEAILDTLMKFRNDWLAVVCTAVSKDSLNAYWKSRPGFHFFQKYIKICPPSKSERLEIFMGYLERYLNNSRTFSNKSLSEIEAATKQAINTKDNDDKLTECIAAALGSVHEQTASPQFLVNIAKKWGTYLQSHEPHVSAESQHVRTRASQINNVITNEDVTEQMAAFNEMLEEEIRFSGDLSELKSRKGASTVSWDAIGGLHEVKEELKKILEWPIKFPQFFKNAPVRLPCGILFYGYPGTGKSMLALAVQSIVNVKFIHVKGPELLSKYIGASEQAVQDVFVRARESSPCILFFDEFDSLVPRRGHDSSGVTDRVVNQFLAEMDGIDGGLGEGVYLIAATSRPDLIDPAVLRPGRLDKHLFFNLPSKTDRKEILKAISFQVTLQLEDESDWNEICMLTDGFSGADLNALMVSAQLIVVQEYLSKLDIGSNKMGNKTAAAASTQEIKVTKEKLLESLQDFKPSIQGQELRKLQALYQGFSFSKRAAGAKELSAGTMVEEASIPWRMEPGKRATLA